MSGMKDLLATQEALAALHSANTYPPSEVERVAEIGMSDFFAGLVEATGATTGDLPPDAYAAFERACRDMTEAWMRANL